MDRSQAARGVLEASVASGYATGMVGLTGQGEACEVFPVGDQAIGGPPVQRDTIYRIASMTKPITAVAAMMLVDEGRLALHEPIDRLMPEMADRRVLRTLTSEIDDTVPAERPITLEDVLTFRLGLGIVFGSPEDYPILGAIAALKLAGFDMPDPTLPYDYDEWARRLSTLPLMAQPGAEWLYTAGSNVLGVLVARASSQSLPDFFQERIFTPLGMTDTAFFVPADKIGRLSTGYVRGEQGDLTLYDPPDGAYVAPPAFPAGDSGLVSTVDDYFAFARFMARKGEANGRQLLSQAAIATMTTNYLTPAQQAAGALILGPDRGWGYGVGVATGARPGGAGPGAYGWDGGFGSTWAYDPASDRTEILLTQTYFDSPDPPAVHTAFQRAIFT
jgi:CubicO group peptidase (beta-lactamase class C family)